MSASKGLPKRQRTGSDEDDFPNTSKIWKPSRSGSHHGHTPPQTLQQQSPIKLSKDSYTVGWICALPLEMTAAQSMLEELHEALPAHRTDINNYTLGRIGRKNVAITCLPKNGYGTTNAATVASHMRRTFPSIYLLLMVGIAGGVPGKTDVRLGDVVVGTRVVQYDLGKTIKDGQFQWAGSSFTPPQTLMTAVSKLDAVHKTTPSRIPSIISEMLHHHPEMAAFQRGNELEDLLFDSSYDHDETNSDCRHCDRSKLVARSARPDHSPAIHYGIVASGNRVMKHGKSRDELAEELGNICFEMEAAGMMGDFPCLAVRGICDYSDSHKNKKWQEYAAACAAAYAKELLCVMSPDESSTDHAATAMPSASDQVSQQEQRTFLLESLRFKHIDARESNIKPAHKETCKWLLDHPEYLNWLDPEQFTNHHGFLWIKGKAGAGKSTLMKFIKERTKMATSYKAATITFFFNARGHDLEKSTIGMHMSLLLQVLEKFPDLQEVLDYRRIPRVPFEDDYHAVWDLDVLRDIFSVAMEKLGERTLLCFIDALDECDIAQVRDMVEYFEDLGQRASEAGSKLYVCFSSRPYPQVSIRYGKQLTLEKQDGHSKDIEKYVRSKLRAGEGKLFNEARDETIRKAAGIFMWVVLVIPILNREFEQGRIFAVRKKLRELPPGLGDLFRDILRKDKENMDEFLLCIQWLLFAKSPLTSEEFYFAMVSGLNQDEEETAEWDPERISKHDMDQFVLSSSKGLAEVTSTKVPVVQFIHESVKDFLLKEKGLWELWPDLSTDLECLSHDRLKHCCNTYLHINYSKCLDPSLPLPKAHSDKAKALRKRTSRKFPFLNYAHRNLLYHADSAAAQLPQLTFLETFALKEWVHIYNLFQIYEIRQYTLNASPMYIFAEHNWARLIRTWSGKQSTVNTYGGRYRYPLYVALEKRHRAAIAALLHPKTGHLREDDVDALLENSKNLISTSVTPLHTALTENSPVLVSMLLETGQVNVSSEYTNDQLSMTLAAGKRNAAIVECLVRRLKVEIPHDEPPASGWASPLRRAVVLADEVKLKTLLEKEVYVEPTGSHGLTPLLEATIWGQRSSVKLLLDHAKVDVNAHLHFEGRFNKPLHCAVEWQDQEMVKLLLETGKVDVNAKNINKETPLLLAISQGNEAIVKMLIQTSKVDFNARDENGRTALHLAILSPGLKKRSIGVLVKILLETGQVDVNAKDHSSSTPLSAAINLAHENVVEMLLKTGQVDVNDSDFSDSTPLNRAISMQNENIVRLLLETGQAELNAIISNDSSPLIKAIALFNESLIKILLGTGQVDVNAMDYYGDIPLTRAINHDTENMVEMLLKTGKVDVNARDRSNTIPLIKAISVGNVHIVRALLGTGQVDVNATDSSHRTALHWAIIHRKEILVELLLDTNLADVNAADKYHETPLHHAVISQILTIVEMLLATGKANVMAKDDRGRTPYFLAHSRGWDAIALVLEEALNTRQAALT